jgi:hypothetical protein
MTAALLKTSQKQRSLFLIKACLLTLSVQSLAKSRSEVLPGESFEFGGDLKPANWEQSMETAPSKEPPQ